jgi:hypothetical protein
MRKLVAADLMTLEQYARERMVFRQQVMAHKALRQVAVGPEMTWSFEDRLTVQYQVQEMLRIERIFEPQGIADELAAYNPLIPDGTNLKATMMIEIAEPLRRRQRLALLKDVENRCWLQVAGCAQVFAAADEDLERANDEKTSAVHFLRFEFTPDMITRLKADVTLAAGVDHAGYRYRVESFPGETTAALLDDLE